MRHIILNFSVIIAISLVGCTTGNPTPPPTVDTPTPSAAPTPIETPASDPFSDETAYLPDSKQSSDDVDTHR